MLPTYHDEESVLHRDKQSEPKFGTRPYRLSDSVDYSRMLNQRHVSPFNKRDEAAVLSQGRNQNNLNLSVDFTNIGARRSTTTGNKRLMMT